MSLPINAKFEVPKHKAPAPTRTSLWPALVPAPAAGKSASATNGSVIRPGSAGCTGKSGPGRMGEGGRALRPITSGDGPMSVGPADGRPRRNRAHKRSTLVKLALPVVPAFLLAATLGLGCANDKAPAKPAGVMNVGGQPAAVAATPEAATPAREPVPNVKADAAAKAEATKADPAKASAKPVAAKPAAGKSIAATPAAAPAATIEAADPAAAPQTYVVQKGDTLTKIAREKYGDGNKWKRIAEANPGLSPSTIKVGQKLIIPVL